MGNFRRDNRSGGRDGGNKFGKRDFGKRSFGGRDGGRPQMFKAICGECGNQCEVPFRPSGDRPVFCNNCFKKDTGGKKSYEPRNRGFEPRFEPRSKSFEPKNDQFEIINVKLDKIYKILQSLMSSAASQTEELMDEEESPKPKRKKSAKRESAE